MCDIFSTYAYCTTVTAFFNKKRRAFDKNFQFNDVKQIFENTSGKVAWIER